MQIFTECKNVVLTLPQKADPSVMSLDSIADPPLLTQFFRVSYDMRSPMVITMSQDSS